MDISSSHSPTTSVATASNSGSLSGTNLNVQITVDAIAQPVSEPIISVVGNPVADAPVNPTYEKPKSISTIDTNVVQPSNLINGEAIPNAEPDKEKDSPIKNVVSESDNKPDKNSTENNKQVFSEAEIELISTLKLRDAEVEAHERAHSSVGGQLAGSPSYSYKTGPDGVKYAVSGEVSIDTSRVAGDPQATLQKAQQIKAAALAPAEPSGQDRKVAAKADQMATQARSEILEASRSEKGEKASINSKYESTVPEHFTGQQNLSIDKQMNKETQLQMHDRNFHINALYQNAAISNTSSEFEVQA